MNKFIGVTIMCLALMSCGQKDLKPVDQASVISKNATQTYFALYDTYKRLEGVLEGEDLAKLRSEVAPTLNTARKHLIAYNDIVIKWREAGGDAKPLELITNEKILNALLAEVSSLLLEFY